MDSGVLTNSISDIAIFLHVSQKLEKNIAIANKYAIIYSISNIY